MTSACNPIASARRARSARVRGRRGSPWIGGGERERAGQRPVVTAGVAGARRTGATVGTGSSARNEPDDRVALSVGLLLEEEVRRARHDRQLRVRDGAGTSRPCAASGARSSSASRTSVRARTPARSASVSRGSRLLSSKSLRVDDREVLLAVGRDGAVGRAEELDRAGDRRVDVLDLLPGRVEAAAGQDQPIDDVGTLQGRGSARRPRRCCGRPRGRGRRRRAR